MVLRYIEIKLFYKTKKFDLNEEKLYKLGFPRNNESHNLKYLDLIISLVAGLFKIFPFPIKNSHFKFLEQFYLIWSFLRFFKFSNQEQSILDV